jgi:energy-coupling factor transport system substrate-specific component
MSPPETSTTTATTESVDDRPSESRIVAMMAITSAITGVGFLLTAPIPLIPGAVQLRIMAFLPVVFGILYGWRTGFVAGGVGNLIWAILGGYFNPATPILDLVAVGLTGAIPGYFVTPEECETTAGLAKATAIATVSGLIMIPIVALGFELVGVAPFFAAVTTLVPADMPGLILGTPIVLRAVVPVLRDRDLLSYRY